MTVVPWERDLLIPGGRRASHPPSVTLGAAVDAARRPPLRQRREHRVVVPFVAGMLQPATRQAVERQAPHAQLWRLDADDQGAYARLLAAMWSAGRTFLIVEQDVVPPAGSLAAMGSCEHPWCAVPYSVGGGPILGMLGCSKFAGNFTATHPSLADVWLRRRFKGQAWCPWRSCDTALAGGMRTAGAAPHMHLPAALHLHRYSTV